MEMMEDQLWWRQGLVDGRSPYRRQRYPSHWQTPARRRGAHRVPLDVAVDKRLLVGLNEVALPAPKPGVDRSPTNHSWS